MPQNPLQYFSFSANNSKVISKFEKKKNFPLVCRARRDESIDALNQRFTIIQRPAIRLKIVVQTDRIDFGMYSQRPFE